MKSSSTSSSSSFSFSPSSSSTSFDAHSFTSKNLTSGCISGIFRRILCSHSLPTYPSDQISASNSKFCKNQQELKLKDAGKLEVKDNSPGVVARLMGLDSMPRTDSVNTQIASDSITRSRSMNSVDFYKAESDQMQGKHRRVKSTLSFHEIPDFIELEDENFFILSFEKGSESREFRSRKGKCEQDLSELKQRNRTEKESDEPKQRKTEECRNRERARKIVKQRNKEDKENDRNAKNAPDEYYKSSRKVLGCNRVGDSINSCCSTRNQEPVVVEVKLRKKQKTTGVDNVENKCSSEDSSPVSVLEFDRIINEGETPISDKSSRKEESLPRRKLSLELEAYECNHNLIEDDHQRRRTIRSRKHDGFNQNYSEMWFEICRITESEIAESNWVGRNPLKLEELEEMNEDVESQILDQLLEETIDQLVHF